MTIVFIAIQLLTLAVAAYAARKAMWASRLIGERSQKSQQDLGNTERQLEIRDHLHFILDLPQGALPPTRGWAGSPDFLLAIAEHILHKKPRVIVECGSGVSTLVIAQALKKNGGGELVSLEGSAEYLEETRNRLQRHGLESFVKLVHAPLVPHTLERGEWRWYDTATMPQHTWDMIIIDGPPEATSHLARYPAGPLLVANMSPDGCVFLDDTTRPDDRETSRLFTQEFGLTLKRLPTEKGTDILSRAI